MGNRERWILEDLYEQCSLHMTEYIANSTSLGLRLRTPIIDSYSSSVSPSARWRGSSELASPRRVRSSTIAPPVFVVSTDNVFAIGRLALMRYFGHYVHMAPTKKRTTMTTEHKAALATGRAQGLAVRRYLEALERNRPRRGRRPSTESLTRQLEDIETRLHEADPLKRLHLIQTRKSIEARLAGGEHAEAFRPSKTSSSGRHSNTANVKESITPRGARPVSPPKCSAALAFTVARPPRQAIVVHRRWHYVPRLTRLPRR